MATNERTKRRVLRAVAAVLVLGTMGADQCPLPALQFVDEDPSTLPVPEVDRGKAEKFIQADLAFGSSDVTTTGVNVLRGHYHRNTGDPPLLLVEVFDDEGRRVDAYDSWHPQWSHVDDPDGTESLQIVELGSAAFRSGFQPDLRSLVVTDRTGPQPEQVADVDLRPAIRSFCEAEPLDPDCERADLAVLGLEAVAPPLALLGTPFPVDVRTTFTNFGPSAPIDATLRKSAIPSPGVLVTPDSVDQEELALLLDEMRNDDEAYTVFCQAAGFGSVEFRSTVELLTVAATDPDPANDLRSSTLSLDCVVPVTVNIKPGGTPNSVNLGSKTVPVAVLTTAPGEYGNPLAFDATSLVVDTVRFGPRDVLLGGGGSQEWHGRLHAEDAIELDDATRDGDTDAVLHFATAGSGLDASSTEACVLGTYPLAGGGSARFFGCDAVRIVPPR